MWRNRKAQSTVEYAVLAALVVGALLTMQIYMKRGTMGKLRESADKIGDQFSPTATTTKYTTVRDVKREEKTTTAGKVESTILGEETSARTGTEDVAAPTSTERVFQ